MKVVYAHLGKKNRIAYIIISGIKYINLDYIKNNMLTKPLDLIIWLP